LGRRCARHAEEMRQALRSPNVLVNVLNGRVFTEEEIANMIVELPAAAKLHLIKT